MSLRTARTPATPAPTPAEILPLENGDHLTRAEFERRYDAMPHLKKAELIEGIVYMGSPVSVPGHANPHAIINGWLDRYCEATPGVEGSDNGSVRIDDDNMTQPDLALYITQSAGGTATINPDGYFVARPELVVEVASSSASHDLHTKKRLYARFGVPEYLVWRVRERAIDWFRLHGDRYEPLPADPAGALRSEVFPGLWLDTVALVGGNRPALSATLALGLATPEHAAFAVRLAAALAAPAPAPAPGAG